MPILTDAKIDAPLTQGDLLTGLCLYATGDDWAKCGGSIERLEKCDLCLVISRPCVARHKSTIVVAAVKAADQDLGDIETFEDVRRSLNRLRDGHGLPDRFYLGQIPGRSGGRYFALLDSLHSVTVPPIPELEEFLKTGRIATLSEDFRRDLHLRLFSAMANLGFDDSGWYSDQDLDWLVQKGEQKLNESKAELSKQEAALFALNASGGAKNRKETEGRQNAIEKLRSEVDRFEDELEGYRREQGSRKHGSE